MRLKLEILVLGLLAIMVSPVNADLIITAAPSTNGIAQVLVTSSSSDNLGQFTVVYDITPDASNALLPVASLEFISPSSSATDPTLIDTNYVYNSSNPNVPGGASFATDTSAVFGVASDPSASGFNTHFAGGDIYTGSAPSGAATLLVGTPYGLSNLALQFNAPGTTNAIGDVFDIRLDLLNSSFYDGSGNPLTVLNPSGLDPIIAFVTVSPDGNITVAPVPEPSSLVISLTAILCGLVWAKRKSVFEMVH